MTTRKEQVQLLIEKYFKPDSLAFHYYSIHSEKVTLKAFEIAGLNKDMQLDSDTIYQSAMLHDIGICKVNAADIGCYGSLPYLAHGYKGREILEKEGFFEIAPVCERHIGMGISKEDILRLRLDLPIRDMLPITDEEKLVCLADKFYSKSPKQLEKEKSIEMIQKGLLKYGQEKVDKLNELLQYFNIG